MKNIFYIFLSMIIVGLGLFLRLYKMTNRAPFDWDQNRDYKVISEIVSGKPTLIGPVAKGDGGFFLGPLYYYLATPAFIIMKSSPSSLPVTSVIIDMLAVVAMLVLLRKGLGDYFALILASIWSFSWFAIEMSHISWNVALVPLWTILLLWLLLQKETLSLLKVGLLGLIIGFSWHVHAALIPISLGVAIYYWKVWALDYKKFTLFVLGYCVPLIPLIIFDIRHSGLNMHLLSQMFISSAHGTVSYLVLVSATMMRLGKNTQSLLFSISDYNLILGYVVTLLSVIWFVRGNGIYKLSGLIIILNVLAVFALYELRFPEYYLAVSYIPTLILIMGTIFLFTKKYSSTLFLLLLLLIIFLNLQKYTWAETSFGLSRKISVAKTMIDLHSPLDLRVVMAPGREGGIAAFYKLYGGTLNSSSKLKVVVTDKNEGPIIEGGELTTVIGNFGGIRVAKIEIQ